MAFPTMVPNQKLGIWCSIRLSYRRSTNPWIARARLLRETLPHLIAVECGLCQPNMGRGCLSRHELILPMILPP